LAPLETVMPGPGRLVGAHNGRRLHAVASA